MKNRIFTAKAYATIDMSHTFELTEAEYRAAIKKYDSIQNYVVETGNPNAFTVLKTGGWDFGDVDEITLQNKKDVPNP